MNKESSEKQINIDQATPRDIWCLASANLLATWRDIASSVPGLPMTPEENWIDAILLDAVDRLITGDRAPDTVQLMREACEIKHWLVRWNAYGCPVYAPTHGLASALILTDCSEVRGRDLQWPYPSVLVELPWPQGPISFYDCANTRVLEGRFLIVHRILFPHLDDGFNRAVEMLNSALQSPTPKFIPGLPDLRRRMLEAVTMRPLTVIHALSEGGTGVHMRDEEPLPDEPLERWLSCDQPIIGESMPLDNHALRAASRLVANLFLYASGLKADGKFPQRSGKPRPPGQYQTTTWPTTWIIGREVKLPKELRDAAREYAERGRSASAREQWKLRSRFSVCGHWRNQACGPKHAEHKRIWIQPHWKGPQDGTAVGKVYAASVASNQDEGRT